VRRDQWQSNVAPHRSLPLMPASSPSPVAPPEFVTPFFSWKSFPSCGEFARILTESGCSGRRYFRFGSLPARGVTTTLPLPT
jgi:hypothetical protein